MSFLIECQMVYIILWRQSYNTISYKKKIIILLCNVEGHANKQMEPYKSN